MFSKLNRENIDVLSGKKIPYQQEIWVIARYRSPNRTYNAFAIIQCSPRYSIFDNNSNKSHFFEKKDVAKFVFC